MREPKKPIRRLRRLHRVWPDKDGNISYLVTACIEHRWQALANQDAFQRFVSFALESHLRYRWYPRRFVLMPDHLHIIGHQGHNAVRIGQWIKAMKAVVTGLEEDPETGRMRRIKRNWRWQEGFHDHKFRDAVSETRKWEYICLNPVRAGLVRRPEDWPYGGEIFFETDGPVLVKGTPPLLETGKLIESPHAV